MFAPSSAGAIGFVTRRGQFVSFTTWSLVGSVHILCPQAYANVCGHRAGLAGFRLHGAADQPRSLRAGELFRSCELDGVSIGEQDEVTNRTLLMAPSVMHCDAAENGSIISNVEG